MMRLSIFAVLLLTSATVMVAQSNQPQLRRLTRIEQITPNPFDPSKGLAEIRFVLAAPGDVELKIFSIEAKEIAIVAHQEFSAGSHRVTWDGLARDGSQIANGAYLCHLRVDNYVVSSTLIVTR